MAKLSMQLGHFYHSANECSAAGSSGDLKPMTIQQSGTVYNLLLMFQNPIVNNTPGSYFSMYKNLIVTEAQRLMSLS